MAQKWDSAYKRNDTIREKAAANAVVHTEKVCGQVVKLFEGIRSEIGLYGMKNLLLASSAELGVSKHLPKGINVFYKLMSDGTKLFAFVGTKEVAQIEENKDNSEPQWSWKDGTGDWATALKYIADRVRDRLRL